jgi:hypothetical protein
MTAAEVAILLFDEVKKGNTEIVADMKVLLDAVALLPGADQHDGGLTIYVKAVNTLTLSS